MQDNNYKITVSEPWDYKGCDTGNLIRGKIISEINSSCCIFQANETLCFDKLQGNILVLFARFEKDIQFLNIKNGISINGGLLLSEYHVDKSIDYLKEHSKFVLIGELSKY